MDQSMPQDNNMTPEEAKAALGHATSMTEQFLTAHAQMQAQQMGQDPTQAPQEAQNAPQQEQEQKPQDNQLVDLEGKMDEKLEILRREMKDTIKTEIGSIRDDIKSALEDETD